VKDKEEVIILIAEDDDGHAEQGKQAGFGDRQVRDERQELDKQSFSY